VSSGETPLVRLEGVSKTYQMGEVLVTALSHTSLTAFEGEFIVILGPSGCGKSTLMNLIGGLDTPTTGTIEVAGLLVSAMKEAELTRYRRETVGFIFQFFNLVATLTARENVALAAELCRDPLPVEDVLRAVGLEARADHFPSEMSGGEQQRVAIARALVKKAPLLLCDEPTGELDFETGRRVLAVLHDTTHVQRRTVIMVTHNSGIAEMADRVLLLRGGQIVEDRRNPNPIDPLDVKW
jgi:putative ABC transport system ATP-binding protein